MKLIIGLGNPGDEYKKTRHNAGFMLIDKIASFHNISVDEKRYKAHIGKGYIDDVAVVLGKPQTFMNLSGNSLTLILKRFNLKLNDLIVIYDDMDLELGKIRIRNKGGSGGHRGLKSVIGALGTDEFIRLKVGIGRPPSGIDPSDYVLTKFNKDELPVLKEAVKTALDAILFLVKGETTAAMNRFNR